MKKILAGILLALLCLHDAAIQAARTFGGASTDRIALSTYVTNHATTTWSIWSYRTGDGGGSFGRMWFKGSTAFDGRLYTTTTKYFFDRESSTSDGTWSITRPSASVWHHILVTYDSGALGNDPAIYLDGTSQTLQDNTNPTGTISNNSEAYTIGNFLNGGSPSQNWAGSLSEFAVWDVILNQGEITALARGISPMNIRLANLKCFIPITGIHTTEPDYSSATTKSIGTVTGATLTAHNPPVQSVFWNFGESQNDVTSDTSAVPFIFLHRRRN